jgi:threonine dehydrogenase-like Zn-dependent dehydrogenase
LISHQVPFENVDQAFALAADRRQAMKVLVKF